MEGNFDQQWALPQTFGAGNALSPELLKWMAQQQPSASGWDGGGYTFGDYTVAPVSGIQTNSDGTITNLGAQGYVSENNALSQQQNVANPNAVANLYGQDGSYQSSFTPEDPYAQDPMELAILAAIAAGGGATLMGLGGGGLGLGNSALGSLGGLGGVAEAGTGIGMMGGSGAATAAGGLAGATSTMGGAPGLSGLSAVDLTATGLPLDAAGSVIGSQAGGGLMSNAAINSMISGAGLGTAGAGGLGSTLTNFLTNPKNLAGLATTALGAASGAGGAGGGGGSGSGSGGGIAQMDSRLDPYVFGSLLPNANATMQAAIPTAQQQSAQMATTGSGLLNQPIAGNGVGQVQMQSPTTAQNPYLSGLADDMQRRTQELLAQANLQTQSNYVGQGMGNTRQGVAQGVSAGKAADSLQGQLAGLYGNAWNADANRSLQKYQSDLGFYDSQRRTDLAGAQTGSGLLSQSQSQLWQPMQAASDLYRPYTALPSASGSGSSSNNWQSIAGGLLSGASLAGKLGWWS